MKVEIVFGALAESIEEQLHVQRVRFDTKAARHWTRDAQAIDRLRIRGLLTDSVTRGLRRRLLRDILKGCTAPQTQEETPSA